MRPVAQTLVRLRCAPSAKKQDRATNHRAIASHSGDTRGDATRKRNNGTHPRGPAPGGRPGPGPCARVSISKVKLWALDRNTFKRTLSESAFRRRLSAEDLLSRVELLQVCPRPIPAPLLSDRPPASFRQRDCSDSRVLFTGGFGSERNFSAFRLQALDASEELSPRVSVLTHKRSYSAWLKPVNIQLNRALDLEWPRCGPW